MSNRLHEINGGGAGKGSVRRSVSVKSVFSSPLHRLDATTNKTSVVKMTTPAASASSSSASSSSSRSSYYNDEDKERRRRRRNSSESSYEDDDDDDDDGVESIRSASVRRVIDGDVGMFCLEDFCLEFEIKASTMMRAVSSQSVYTDRNNVVYIDMAFLKDAIEEYCYSRSRSQLVKKLTRAIRLKYNDGVEVFNNHQIEKKRTIDIYMPSLRMGIEVTNNDRRPPTVMTLNDIKVCVLSTRSDHVLDLAYVFGLIDNASTRKKIKQQLL